MADPDLYGGPDTESSSPSQPEEISAFFNHFLHGPSSASSSSRVRFRPLFDHSTASPPPPPYDAVLDPVEDIGRTSGSAVRTDLVSRNAVGKSGSGADLSSSSGFDVSDHAAYFGSGLKDMTENATSSTGDISWESEKRSGASEMPSNIMRPSSSSKRCRAAEVHNLSEKRRRSRINERLKALQKLIPNSNKTDKASMLDEAIEYLKQLQLRVQMLVMSNGVSLYPGILNPMKLCRTGGMSYLEGYGQQLPSLPRFDPLSDIAITSETRFGFEPSSSRTNYGLSREGDIGEENKELLRS
ncbi:PREDICTED: transcription factor SPATULA-like [Tarenaya hassleriana]|uniref:transcription factor SPATULA-like n=1 Tax=Tarenaya hassleriana TaxID=28532 RepID=UPI00053C3615|nr:PREDICTED: transcription factor SPATULA-like [Tarenaya hassleriana]